VAKSNPTVTNTASAGDSAAATLAFRDVTHKGHPLTHVGSFIDGKEGNPPYDVWYCRTDHQVFIA
jgi:hypothetical protein